MANKYISAVKGKAKKVISGTKKYVNDLSGKNVRKTEADELFYDNLLKKVRKDVHGGKGTRDALLRAYDKHIDAMGRHISAVEDRGQARNKAMDVVKKSAPIGVASGIGVHIQNKKKNKEKEKVAEMYNDLIEKTAKSKLSFTKKKGVKHALGKAKEFVTGKTLSNAHSDLAAVKAAGASKETINKFKNRKNAIAAGTFGTAIAAGAGAKVGVRSAVKALKGKKKEESAKEKVAYAFEDLLEKQAGVKEVGKKVGRAIVDTASGENAVRAHKRLRMAKSGGASEKMIKKLTRKRNLAAGATVGTSLAAGAGAKLAVRGTARAIHGRKKED